MTRDPYTGRPMVPLSNGQRMEVARSCGKLLYPARFQQLERLVIDGPGRFLLCDDDGGEGLNERIERP